MLSVNEVFRQDGPEYLARFGDRMLPSHRHALDDLVACRTAAMGGQVLGCQACGHHQYVYHSCRNRACPQCHEAQTRDWLAARARELLPVPYFHLVFTLTGQLRQLAASEQSAVLGALMTAAAEALQKLARDPRFAGGKIGILAVLHTWTRALAWHPHVHLLVPGLVLLPDRQWRVLAGNFLVPVRALSPIFRAKFAAQVRRRLPETKLPDRVFEKDWGVFCRGCAEGPKRVLDYLARYVCRGPLTGRRLESAGPGRVRLHYRHRDTGKPCTAHFTTTEFMRRYLQHTLPQGFHRVRYYGLWAPANRQNLCALQLQMAPGLRERAEALVQASAPASAPARVCPRCGSTSFVLLSRWRRGDSPPPTPGCRGPP